MVIGLWRAMSMPISSITATANGSSSPFCTPAEAIATVCPNSCCARPAAIGERTAFMPQANSTARGRKGRSGIAASTLPVQDADQREQAAGGVDIDFHFLLEPLHQNARTVVVDGATAHVDR